MGDDFIKSQDLNRRMQRSKSDSYSLYGGDKSRYVHNHHRAKYRYHGKSHCNYCIVNCLKISKKNNNRDLRLLETHDRLMKPPS